MIQPADPVGNKSTDFYRLSLILPCTISVLYLVEDLNKFISFQVQYDRQARKPAAKQEVGSTSGETSKGKSREIGW